ncbi:MAG TPA: hypothetical protein VH062_03455 [Polyangiaceae bacterium]|nr:hypothetical protein [Polyangiaceae bacterium]
MTWRPTAGAIFSSRRVSELPLLIALAVSLVAASASAEPEWSSSIIPGAIIHGAGSSWNTSFYGAVRGDALFFRTNRHAFGFGPALEVGTSGFSDVRLLGSAEFLAPIGEFLAVSVAPGVTVRSSSVGAVPGLSGRAFFGMRAYGYTDYSLNAGLVLGFDHDLGGPREHAIVVGAQIDGLVLALPVLFLVSLFHGSGS